MSEYMPALHSEREDPNGPRWMDCTWASAMMLRDAASLGRLPTTVAEREALERACDRRPETGASLADLDQAMQRRYGRTFDRPPADRATFDRLLMNGYAAVVQGDNARMPEHFHRWDPAYRGGHAALVADYHPAHGYWFMDPEATAGYAGEWMSAAEFWAWCWGPLYARFAARGSWLPEEVEMIVVNDAVPHTVTLPVGTPLLDSAGNELTRVHTGGDAVYSPFTVVGSRFGVVVSIGGTRQVAFVKASLVTRVRALGT